MSELPTLCFCGNSLRIDYKFVSDSKVDGYFKVRLFCLNGHSQILDLGESKEIDKEPRPEKARIIRRRLEKPRARNRSVLCDVCRQRVYNAAPNQKRHSGACMKKALQIYYHKFNQKKKLQRAS